MLTPDGRITDPYRNFIATSRYARWLEKENRRETWTETVDRYFTFMTKELGDKADPALVSEIREAVLNHEIMPSMRAVMTAGPALERNHIAAYNCAFLPVDDLRAFDETLYVLSCGTGVGYSVESQYVSKIPAVSEAFSPTETVIQVADSKEGWAKAYRELLALLWAGQVPQWDVSKVRPRGARLKTFGGRASGPAPLVDLFEFTIKLVTGAAGRKITPLEAHDIMCKIGDVIVSGGVRRSALISLSDLNDYDMAHAKSGAWWENEGQRALANNSAVYEKSPSMEQFMSEWHSLYSSRSGERGIVNRQAMREQAEKNGRRDGSKIAGTNPCCVAGDTLIMTSTGAKRIDSLRGTPFKALVNGVSYDAPHGSWVSGTGSVHELVTKEGHSLTLTPEHRILRSDDTWVQAQDLKKGDKITLHNHSGYGNDNYNGAGYLMGMFVGDGNFFRNQDHHEYAGEVKVWKSEKGTANILRETEETARKIASRSDWAGWSGEETVAPYFRMNIGRMPQQYGINPDNKYDISMLETETPEFQRGFLRGIFDADGHVENWREGNTKGLSIRLGQSNYSLLQSVQRMLLQNGINSKIYAANDAGSVVLPNGKGGTAEYQRKAGYRLAISAQSVFEFDAVIGFSNSVKQGALDTAKSWRKKVYQKPFGATVESFEYVGEQEVWDAEVSEVYAFDANGIYAHNSEIILRPYQFCNLSEVVVNSNDTFKELQHKVYLAAILGTWQSTLTNFKYIRKIWKTNTEEERLLGVSLTGSFGHKVLNTNNAKLVKWLTTLKETAVETNKVEALRIGIPQSAAVTCVKPSGCRPGNGLVTTHEGIYTLDELLEHHPQNDDWANTDLTSVQGDKISRTYRNGRSEVWKVALTHGMEVESTPNHQWWVKGMRKRNRTGWDSDFIPGWYRTDEIVPEHVLDLNLGVYEGTNDAQLIASTKLLYHNVVTRKTPSRLTPDFGWMLGYLWGDGSFSPHKNRIRFVDHSKSNLEKVQNIFQEYFGYDGTIQRASDRDAYEYTVASVEVYNFFVANGFWKYREGGGLADIPLKVRESTHETILAFIAGMIDSDGCVFRRGERRNISISTADKNFAKHLQDVALTVGIGLGRSLNTEGTNFQEQKSMWLLTANSLTVASRFEMSMKHSVKATNHLPELAWVPLTSQYQHIGGKVVSVGFDRFEDTYDVEVENSHWFYAGAVKSHNTVSQLTGVSSGLHPWHNDHYIRTVRGSNDDPLTQFMAMQGIPSEPDVTKPDATTVFSFPVKAPKGATTRNDLTAIEHLELWLTYQRAWCEHKPSVTISVREEEWLEVGAWVFKHFDELSGVSFLPHSEHTYQQAPYQDITEEEYKKVLAEFPKDIHWEDLPLYEIEDATTGTQELSCTAGACEIVSIGDTE